jgi:hypothetical protein
MKRPGNDVWWLRSAVLFAAICGGRVAVGDASGPFASHPPTRPLPRPSERPLGEGPAFFVDAAAGDDRADGSKSHPWKTLAHSITRLRTGDTLYLRGGTYYEHVVVSQSGTIDRPITIRSYPGELVVIDGGLREFFDEPAAAWTPCPDGAPGEFQSSKTYPDLGGGVDETNVLGNFGDSMLPLQGYRFRGDLQSDNPYWNVGNKVGGDASVYCGPGVWYDPASGRIHARLAHTRLAGLGNDNYRGETDPRKLPLVIAGHRGGSALAIEGARHVRLQDLVLRGSRVATLAIRNAADIELDGLTIYGGSTAVEVRDTVNLRVLHAACRGIAAPWTFRGSLKYRAIEARIFSASGWLPTGADNRDFELAYSEFTDCVDGVFIGNVRGVRFHHNLLDNVSDDGIFLTATTGFDGTTHGGDVHIYQNVLSRCLTTFAFGVGHGRQKTIATGKQMGAGVHVYRNVFDFRRPVMYYWPTGPDAPQEISSYGRVASDHGSPAWEPMRIYHNTIIAGEPPRYDYGTSGLAGAMGHGTQKRVFNNIVHQLHGLPGQTMPDPATDFDGDGNVQWSVSDGPGFQGEWNSKFRRSAAFEATKARYKPGWTAHDQFRDPKFVRFDGDWRAACDLRLAPDSPAIDAGVELPGWPDAALGADAGAPDAGAIPSGAAVWRVGVGGRLNASGGAAESGDMPTEPRRAFPIGDELARPAPAVKPALVLEGYPAFDSPLVQFALRRRGAPVTSIERTWLDPREFSKFYIVVIDGSFARAKIEPNKFNADELARLRLFLEDGGTLVLMRERTDLFATPEGRDFLAEILGPAAREPAPELELRKPDHPWVSHLAPRAPHAWLNAKAASVLQTSRAENIIGTAAGATALCRAPVGKGQLIYIGWSIAASLPNGRQPSSLEQEVQYEEQFQILDRVIASLYPDSAR